jgi:carbon storage regulator
MEEHNVLVLSRLRGQEIVIGREITVKVLEVTGTRVRLGVVAPVQVPVRRESLCMRVETLAGKRL